LNISSDLGTSLCIPECTEHMFKRRGRDRIVVGFTTTYAISAYHYKRCEFEPRSWRGVLDKTICNKVSL